MKQNKIIPKLRFPEFENEREWEMTTLDKVALYENGKAHEQDISENGDYIVVNAKFIATNGEVRKHSNTAVCIADKNDILMVLSDLPNGRALGKCFYVDMENKYTVNQRICKLSSKGTNSVLLYYLLDRNSYFLSFDDGVKQSNLKKDDILDCPLTISSNKDEQQKIADCLSSLDEVITQHEEKLLSLEKHKKGLMQNLFPQEGETTPKYRFPEFENEGDWEEVSLIDIADNNIKWSFTGGPFGSNLKASDYTNEGIRIIQLQNIGDGVFNDLYRIYTSIEKANELLSCNIYSGDIILSKMGDPVGRACIMPGENDRFVMASDGIRLAVNENKYSKYFIFSLINSKIVRTEIENKSTGSTRKRISLDVLKKIQLLLPLNRAEQQKIADCLSTVDGLIRETTERIEELKQHKQGLIQGLFPKIEE